MATFMGLDNHANDYRGDGRYEIFIRLDDNEEEVVPFVTYCDTMDDAMVTGDYLRLNRKDTLDEIRYEIETMWMAYEIDWESAIWEVYVVDTDYYAEDYHENLGIEPWGYIYKEVA